MERCFKTGERCAIDNLKVVAGQVFVGMPFKPPYNDLYDYGIRPALQGLGLTPWIADKNPGVNDLLCKICRGLQSSVAAIIDISEPNPNVYFELGLLASLSKPLIMIKQDGLPVPSDLAGMECPRYSDAKTLRTILAERLSLLISKTNARSKIIPYATYKAYYDDLIDRLGSTQHKIDLTHIREESPREFEGASEWFEKVIEWADNHPHGRVRRIISAGSETMRTWAAELQQIGRERRYANFEVRVCRWEASFPAVNLGIFDRHRVFVALTGATATETPGFSIAEPAIANYFVDYYNNIWARARSLEGYLRGGRYKSTKRS